MELNLDVLADTVGKITAVSEITKAPRVIIGDNWVDVFSGTDYIDREMIMAAANLVIIHNGRKLVLDCIESEEETVGGLGRDDPASTYINLSITFRVANP